MACEGKIHAKRKARLVTYSDSCAKRNLKYEVGVPLLSESSGSYEICLLGCSVVSKIMPDSVQVSEMVCSY